MKESDKTEWKYIAAFVAILAVGTIAFVVLVGEQSPNSTSSSWGFMLGKGIAFAVLYGCCKAWKLVEHSEARKNMEDFMHKLDEKDEPRERKQD